MNGKKVMLTIQGEKKEYPAGTSFLRIAQDYSDAYQDDIVLVLYNRRLRELNKCRWRRNRRISHNRRQDREKGVPQKRDTFNAEGSL